MTQEERLLYLLDYLKEESGEYKNAPMPDDPHEKKRLLRGLMNLRPPLPAPREFLSIQDEYLLAERETPVSLADLHEVEPDIYLWQGDITRLSADAIVNAANSALLGCFIPCHNCIDNIIHTAAGVQLRLACAEISTGNEPVGEAKITKAYNLPCRYVIHTVGPMIQGELTQEDCRLLASCYLSCLKLATSRNLASLAFCCISTGVFHFPQQQAAEIAIQTTREYLKDNNSGLKVIFDVYTDRDYAIYRSLLADSKKN